MRDSLRQKCDALLENSNLVGKSGFLESNILVRLGGLLYLNHGMTPDPERIKACKAVLKEHAGLFSNFRGVLDLVVRLKMAMSDNPDAYLREAMRIYGILKEGVMLPGDMIAMTALTIKDNCPEDRVDEVAVATREAWRKINKAHPILTDEADMSLIALMCIAGMDPDTAAEKAEEIYQALRDNNVPYEASQSCSMVLALSDKPTDEKVANLVNLYDALRDSKHASRLRDKTMAIYAAFADIDVPIDELVKEIGEVDDYLREKKLFPFGTSTSMRRVFAAAIVLEDRNADIAGSITANTSSAVTQAIAEDVVLMIMMIIMITIINNNLCNS